MISLKFNDMICDIFKRPIGLLLLINQIGTSWNVMENYVSSSSERGASELRSAHSHTGETGWVHGSHVVGGGNSDI